MPAAPNPDAFEARTLSLSRIRGTRSAGERAASRLALCVGFVIGVFATVVALLVIALLPSL